MIGEVNMADEKKPFRKLTWRLAAIARCRQCALTPSNSKNCTIKGCALWHFRTGKPPAEDINALDLLIYDSDPTSVIFRARKPKDENDDGVSAVRTEYPAYIEDDELDEDEDDEE